MSTILSACTCENDSSMVCLTQCAVGAAPLLLKPVEPVAVALAVDHVHLAVVVHVVADDRKSGVLHLPVAMPLPLILVGIDLLEPAVWSKDVGLAVAVDIRHADAVPILLQRPPTWCTLGSGPEKSIHMIAHVAVMGEHRGRACRRH